jgi:hypothetical protein
MTIRELENAGLDLWLMGHTHITWPDKPGNRDIIFNPGTPEPDGFDCKHEGCAFLHSINGRKERETQIINTGTHRFVQASETISDSEDISKLINHYSEESWQQNVLSLKVTGKLEEDTYKKWEDKRSKIRKGVLELRLDDSGVRRKVTNEQIQKEFSEGSFPKQLLSSLSEKEDEEELQMAYELIKEAQQ